MYKRRVRLGPPLAVLKNGTVRAHPVMQKKGMVRAHPAVLKKGTVRGPPVVQKKGRGEGLGVRVSGVFKLLPNPWRFRPRPFRF